MALPSKFKAVNSVTKNVITFEQNSQGYYVSKWEDGGSNTTAKHTAYDLERWLASGYLIMLSDKQEEDMELPEEFKFRVYGDENRILYTARKEANCYVVSWTSNETAFQIVYPVFAVEGHVRNGRWDILENEEYVDMDIDLDDFMAQIYSEDECEDYCEDEDESECLLRDVQDFTKSTGACVVISGEGYEVLFNDAEYRTDDVYVLLDIMFAVRILAQTLKKNEF